MPQWDHEASSWGFYGPHVDSWPGQEPVAAHLRGLRKQQDGLSIIGYRRSDVPDALMEGYDDWCEAEERAYLQAMGDAGFELVAVHRQVKESTLSGGFGWTEVRAYFKRERQPEAQPVPPPIGFRQPME